MSLVSYSEIFSDGFLARIIADEQDGFLVRTALTPELLHQALVNVLFALPIRGGVFLPNPQTRFCLDLRHDIKWFRSAKTRRHLHEFNISVKVHLQEDLEAAARYHLERGAGNWLTPDIIRLLDDMSVASHEARAAHGAGASALPQMYSFSLVEKASGRTAAITFGFGSGAVFEDYTMCTLIRDGRSCGAILNKLVGSILQQVGYEIWYWGYEVPYMRDYISHYGARHIPRSEFYAAWEPTRSFSHRPFSSVVPPGGVAVVTE